MNTYVYSVTPVTAQDYNHTSLYTHSVFLSGLLKENRHLASYQDNGSAWRLVVHGFIDSVLMSEGGNIYHLVRAAF